MASRGWAICAEPAVLFLDKVRLCSRNLTHLGVCRDGADHLRPQSSATIFSIFESANSRPFELSACRMVREPLWPHLDPRGVGIFFENRATWTAQPMQPLDLRCQGRTCGSHKSYLPQKS